MRNIGRLVADVILFSLTAQKVTIKLYLVEGLGAKLQVLPRTCYSEHMT